MQSLLSIIKYLLSALFLLAISSCHDEEENPIPDRNVNITTPYSDFMQLRNAGSHVEYRYGNYYASGTLLGYGGVLIFRDYDNKIHAADLACPVEVDENVTVDVEMPYAVCPTCKTKYDLTFGFCTPVSGPGTFSLKIYESVFERGDYIQVRH